MARTTQAKRVIEYIKDFGSISSMEAFRDLGITRLSAVIFQLKDTPYQCFSVTEKSVNRYGEPTQFARYKFVYSVEERRRMLDAKKV